MTQIKHAKFAPPRRGKDQSCRNRCTLIWTFTPGQEPAVQEQTRPNLYPIAGDERPFDLLKPGCANLGVFGARCSDVSGRSVLEDPGFGFYCDPGPLSVLLSNMKEPEFTRMIDLHEPCVICHEGLDEVAKAISLSPPWTW